jgi:poly(A) polymerase Pap1
LLLSVAFLLGAVPNIVPFLQEDFFIVLHDILSQTEEVTHLQPVPDAHVPVMKFKFHGISIDLLYASVSLLVVPSVSLYPASYVHPFVCF